MEFKEIYLEDINLSESDIDNCDDIYQLKEWMITLNKKSSFLNACIMELKVKRDNGENTNEEYCKKMKYKTVLSIIKQKLNNRIGYVSNRFKQSKNNTADRVLIECLKEIVSTEQFNIAVDMMMRRTGAI